MQSRKWLTGDGTEMPQEDVVFLILASLPDSYGPLINAIESKENLTVKYVLNKIRHGGNRYVLSPFDDYSRYKVSDLLTQREKSSDGKISRISGDGMQWIEEQGTGAPHRQWRVHGKGDGDKVPDTTRCRVPDCNALQPRSEWTGTKDELLHSTEGKMQKRHIYWPCAGMQSIQRLLNPQTQSRMRCALP